jgi:hypothetical protein
MRDRVLVVLGALLAIAPLTVPERVWAQDAATSAAAEADTDQGAPDADLLTADELDVLMAPVALYPDTLLAQILYATTYPLDVVKAGRFVEQNVGMPDKDRADAVKTMDWDPSVQALAAGFPDLVTRMNDNIDWTEQVGDAVLVQTDDVMDSVQRLRDQAAETGYLTTNDAQTVNVSADNTITIAPTNPEVVYVPAYDSNVVYTQPAPAQVVYLDDGGGTDFGDALATGAIVFGTAMILDEIFDDNDPWDDYWRGPSHVDWDNHDFNARPNVDINGDVNIGSNNNFANIDRDKVQIDRDKVSFDRNRTDLSLGDGSGERLGSLDRDGIDRDRDRTFKPDDAKRNEAREKMAARKASGGDVARLPASAMARDQAKMGQGSANLNKPAGDLRPAQQNKRVAAKPQGNANKAAAAAKRPDKISRPSTGGQKAIKKSPPKGNAFEKSGGSRAKAASNRGRASAGKRRG